MRALGLLVLVLGCTPDDTEQGSDTEDTEDVGDLDQDGFTEDEGDCDDEDPLVYPGATVGEADEWTAQVLPADVLVCFDHSGSMGSELDGLAAEGDTFVGALHAAVADWQLIVANGDDGCRDTLLLTPTMLDAAQLFQAGVSVEGGELTGALLTVAVNAVAATDPGESNEHFLRDDSLLHVVFFTDGADESVDSWETNLAALQATRADPRRVKVSLMGGEVPKGCAGADPSTGYWDAVQATGGEFQSICDSFDDGMAALGAASAVVDDVFPISADVVVESIEVRVDGEVHSAWSWDEVRVAVVVDGLSAGDSVEISYQVPGDCPLPE